MAPRIITITLEQQGIMPRPQCCFSSRSQKLKWRKKELRRLKLPLDSQKMIQCPQQSSRDIAGKPYCSNHTPSTPKRSKPPKRFVMDPYYDSIEWRMLRFDVLQRDKHICQYCGDKARQADHVIPRRKGGYDHLDNLVACCASCNRVAGNNQFPTIEEKRLWILAHRKSFKTDSRPTDILNCINRSS